MKKRRFVWIDDNIKRLNIYRTPIETGISAQIELLKVDRDILNTLSAWVAKNRKRPPALFLLDHVYNLPLPFSLNGSSVAHLLRSAFPRVPIVCVTAKLDDQHAFDQDDLAEYTAIFPYTKLDRYVEDLDAIARDFPKLASASNGEVRRHVVHCLKAPRRDREDLLRLLPAEFTDERHPTTEHRIAQWIYNALRRRPGFLYDQLYAATLLGLNESGFRKVEGLFEKALYKGVFAAKSHPRWWASELRRVLFSLTPDDGPETSQYAGRMLPGITKAHFSVCYISRESEPPPDAVAFVDATKDAARKVVRREYTEQHPSDAGLTPGFETQVILRRRKAA